MVLSVVIVNWNTRDLLRTCLGLVQEAAQGLDREIIVVDNASQDGSAEMMHAEFPDVALLENQENLGFARAVNQGILASRGQYVALLNTDVVLTAGSLCEMVNYLKKNVNVAAVAPQLVGRGGRMQYSGGNAPSPSAAFRQLFELHLLEGKRSHGLFVRSRQSSKALALDWLSAACMVISRRAVDSVGMMDESHFMYAEDVEYGIRLRRAGWQVHLLPWIRVVHYQGASSSAPEMRLMWLAGVFRVAADNLSRAGYVLFGFFLSAAYMRRCLMLKAIHAAPQGAKMIHPEVANVGDMHLYAKTAFGLALRHPSRAGAFCEELEKSFRGSGMTECS